MEFNYEICSKLKQYNTPFYFLDEERFIRQIEETRKEAENAAICFSMKANPFLIKTAAAYVDFIEVCSLGELKICIRNQIEAKQIVLAGINKETDYIDAAYGYGVRNYIIESERQMEKLVNSLSKQKDYFAVIALRLDIGNQFGMSLKEAETVCRKYVGGQIQIDGLHIYAGTQNRDEGKQQQHLELLRKTAEHLNGMRLTHISRIVYGCGTPVEYFATKNENTHQNIFVKTVAQMKYQLPGYKQEYELGRYLAASCGYYVTKVIECRQHDKTYIITDGGTHQLTYYNQQYGRRLPYIKQIPQRKERNKCVVCGSLCTAADIIVNDSELWEAEEGDYLIFENIGAYTMTDGMQLFLSRELPAVYFRRQSGEVVCIREPYDTGILNGGTKIGEK